MQKLDLSRKRVTKIWSLALQNQGQNYGTARCWIGRSSAVFFGTLLQSSLLAQICLETRLDFPTGYDSEYVAACDFNRDGLMDLASTDRPFIDPGNTVAVLMNTDGRNFAAPVSYPVGLNPEGVACGDFDGINGPDLAVSTQNALALSVLLNAGDGTFLPKITYSTGNASLPYQLMVRDIDADSHLDLVMVMRTSDRVGIMTNAGDGTFVGPTEYVVDAFVRRVTACDLHNDNDWDLITTNSLFGTISVLENTGFGIFADYVTYPVGAHPQDLACCDLDNDSNSDLAVTTGDFTVQILLNTGDGQFAAPTPLRVGVGPSGVACADLDGDGLSEVIVGNSTSQTVSVLHNLGGATFAPDMQFATGFGFAGQVISENLDGVGGPDIAVAKEGTAFLSVLLNCASADSDADGVPDAQDNCSALPNADQTDSNLDGIGNACDADIVPIPVNDCVVNFLDLRAVADAFFSTDGSPGWNPDADFTGDGTVNFADLDRMKEFFFAQPGPSGITNDCDEGI